LLFKDCHDILNYVSDDQFSKLCLYGDLFLKTTEFTVTPHVLDDKIDFVSLKNETRTTDESLIRETYLYDSISDIDNLNRKISERSLISFQIESLKRKLSKETFEKLELELKIASESEVEKYKEEVKKIKDMEYTVTEKCHLVELKIKPGEGLQVSNLPHQIRPFSIFITEIPENNQRNFDFRMYEDSGKCTKKKIKLF
jgi:hypothetical protein